MSVSDRYQEWLSGVRHVMRHNFYDLYEGDKYAPEKDVDEKVKSFVIFGDSAANGVIEVIHDSDGGHEYMVTVGNNGVLTENLNDAIDFLWSEWAEDEVRT